ncbi:MAG: hypothetical protein LBN21_09040, partial [Treponema sp.]|nr:hypothetical protein [Treponema sp.]
MRTILYFILTCCTLVFSACPLFLYDSDVNAPSYKKNVVWSFEIESRGNQAETVYHDGYAYIQESSFLMHPYTPEPFCRLLKVNLDDGQIIWKTRDLSYGST